MGFYIGIEGGGTKTVAILGNDIREIVATALVGATNYHSAGKEKVCDEIIKIINRFVNEKNIVLGEVEGICFGGAGIDCREDEIIMRKIFNSIGYDGRLHICNDSVVALAGANDRFEGAILISGTGSIAYGVDINGQPVRVGGWGHLIDDTGSGYSIARDCLKRIMESYDGRGQKTLLWDSVKNKLKVSRQEELIPYIYSPNTQKQHIAELAPYVFELYDRDDTAYAIINDAIDGLCSMVLALSERMKLTRFSLGLGGSILIKSELYRRLLEERVGSLLPEVDIHLPYKDAAYGALIMALALSSNK